jgi:hypothetical protein
VLRSVVPACTFDTRASGGWWGTCEELPRWDCGQVTRRHAAPREEVSRKGPPCYICVLVARQCASLRDFFDSTGSHPRKSHKPCRLHVNLQVSTTADGAPSGVLHVRKRLEMRRRNDDFRTFSSLTKQLPSLMAVACVVCDVIF